MSLVTGIGTHWNNPFRTENELRQKRPSSRTRAFSHLSFYDLAWAAISPLIAFLIRDGTIFRVDSVSLYCCVALITSLCVFQWFKVSAPISGFFSAHDAFVVAQACLISVALTAVFLFTFTRLYDAPRSIPILHFFILSSGLFGGRALVRVTTKRANNNAYSSCCAFENVLIIEASRLAWFFTKMVEELSFNGIRIVAVLDARPSFHNRSINGYSIVGPPAHLEKIIDEYAIHGVQIHRIVIATQPDSVTGTSFSEIREICKSRNISVELLHERLLFSSPKTAVEGQEYGQNDEFMANYTGSSYWKIKRALDVGFALVGLVAIAPLAFIVAVLVLVDVGAPIVFWQQRTGRYGRPLSVYKFRTLRAAFDRDGNQIQQSRPVSALGQFLRNTRLDEIPQLFNILTGSMSLIGPRPLLPADQPKSIYLRLQVRPGITGLAQVNGANLLSSEEKNALDEWYVRHASPLIDIQILFRTVRVIVCGESRNEQIISTALSEAKSFKRNERITA